MDSTRQWLYADATVRIDRVVVGPLDNNVFLIVCAKTLDSVIVDAASEPDEILRLAGDTNVQAILTTHGHWDHVGAAAAVSSAMKIPVYIGAEDAAMTELPATEPLDDETFAIGNLEAQVIKTPGHTPGSRSLKVGHLIFTGDTLFPGGPGATTSRKNFDQIMESLDSRLFTQPDETMILPGHGLNTTIGAERSSVEEWRRRGW